ncbi:MAG: hypothetical protein GY737_00280 [Desulfobacteraceae bacterium]|nr:hypothetical protein [Desulfobacteraceae bacterium]
MAAQATPKGTVTAGTPFQGYVPDIDPAHLSGNVLSNGNNLVSRAEHGQKGEILGHPPGFSQVEAATLPLGADANTANDITGIFFVPRTTSAGARSTEFDFTTMAVTAGDGSNAGSCELWRRLPSTGAWEEIVFADPDPGTEVAMKGEYPSSGDDSDQLFDHAVYAPGSPNRTAHSGPIEEPCLVFCNLHDPVQVFPAGTGLHTYEALSDDFGAGDIGFRARSCEAWGDRMNYLNTIESGTHHRQRLRRSAIGNADPDTAFDGQGAIDFREFSGDGLRCLGLGDKLACYFEDGVALVQRSGNTAAPYTRRILTTKRGLLSTHSVVQLGGGVHFGLFTDGWFLLDQGGQWQEVGLSQVANSVSAKWKETFYNRLDDDLRSRIDIEYDQKHGMIYITLPFDGNSQNEDVWIYDIAGDRVWPQSYPVTKWGEANVQLKAAQQFQNVTTTFAATTGTFASFGAQFGVKTLMHGTHNGFVMQHDNDITTRVNEQSEDEVEPSYNYTSVLSNLGEPRNVQSVDEMFMEYIKTTASNATFKVFGNDGTFKEAVVDLPGSTGDLKVAKSGFLFSSSHLGFEVNGQGPIKIRSIGVDAFDYGVRKI